MKKILLASVAVVAFCGAPALAADMPVKGAPVAPMFSWSGCYVGVEGGGDWGHSRHRADDHTTIADFKADGGIFGGTIGCNAQNGQWVFGIENDLSWTGVKGHELDNPPFNPAFTSGTKSNWLDTLRGRLGIAMMNRSLWYVTGGAAFTDIKQFGDNGAGVTISQSKSRAGWALGGGVEWAMADPRWSWKIEYIHVDFGFKLYPGNAIFVDHNINLTENIVRVGLNWRGDWGKGPVSAKY